MSNREAVVEELKKYRENIKTKRVKEEIPQEVLEFFIETIEEACNNNHQLNEHGIKNLKSFIKKYEHAELIEAIDVSFSQYYKWNTEEEQSPAFEKAFNYIPRIAVSLKKEKQNPELAEKNYHVNYCKKILENNFDYVNITVAKDLLNALLEEYTFDSVKDICCKAHNWSQFRAISESWLQELETENK